MWQHTLGCLTCHTTLALGWAAKLPLCRQRPLENISEAVGAHDMIFANLKNWFSLLLHRNFLVAAAYRAVRPADLPPTSRKLSIDCRSCLRGNSPDLGRTFFRERETVAARPGEMVQRFCRKLPGPLSRCGHLFSKLRVARKISFGAASSVGNEPLVLMDLRNEEDQKTVRGAVFPPFGPSMSRSPSCGEPDARRMSGPSPREMWQ